MLIKQICERLMMTTEMCGGKFFVLFFDMWDRIIPLIL